MRQELALAKAEMQAEAKTAGKAAGMLAGGGLAAWLALICLSLTAIWTLDHVMDIAWAAFIVTVVWAIVAAVLLATGRTTLKKVNPKPEQTIESVKEDAQWLNPRKS
jgi:membrane protein implicated in regulation of membrane protease activity